MEMAPSGLAAARTTPLISHGAQGGVELRSSLAGRPLAKGRPRAKSHSSRPASRLVVRAARQVSVVELSNGFTLFSFSLDEDSDSEDQTGGQPVSRGSHAAGGRQDGGSHATGVSPKAPISEAAKGKQSAASDHNAAPQRRAPPKFIKLSPVPAAKLRGLQKEAEAAELRQAVAAEEAAKAPVVVSKKPPDVKRPPSSFVKRSPVVGSLSGASGLGSSRISPVQGVRLRSKFVKRSPLADFRQRRDAQHQEQQREAGSLAADSSSPLSPPPLPRPQSKFSKRSPVADWAARPRTLAAGKVPKVPAQVVEEEAPAQEAAPVTPVTVALPSRPPSAFTKASPVAAAARSSKTPGAEAAAPSKLSVARPPSGFQKKSPIVMAKAVFGATGRVRGVPSGADSSSAGAVDGASAPLRPPSSFQKRSPVLDAQGRPVVIRAVPSLELKTAPPEVTEEATEETPTLVGTPSGATASESPSATAATAAPGSPERQPSSFKRVFRPLPATEPQVPASQIPIQAEPNGTAIHNRLPVAQPLGPQSPALMEGWGEAESSADGLVTVEETVVVESAVTVEEMVTVQEAVTEVEESDTPAAQAEGGTASGEKHSAEELAAMTVASLKELAKGSGLKGYSKLKKKELIDLLLQSP